MRNHPSPISCAIAAAVGVALMSTAAQAAVDFANFTAFSGNGSVIPWSLSPLTVSSSSNNPAATFGTGADVISPITGATFINSPLYTAPYGNSFIGYVSYEERLWSQTVTTVYNFQNILTPASKWQMLLHNVDLNEVATIRVYDALNNLVSPASAWAAPVFIDVQEPQNAPATVHASWNPAAGTLTGLPVSTFDSIAVFNPLVNIKRIEVDYFLWGNGGRGDFQGGAVAFVVPTVPIPEPSTALFGLALVGICSASRRRR